MLILLSAVLTAVLLLRSTRPRPSAEPAAASAKIDQEDILLFLEAISTIRDRAMFLGPETKREPIIYDALKSYLNRADRFSDFLSRDEYRNIRALDERHYVGIGMEIREDHQGRVICFPYPAGPAARSGIRAGDRLNSIDGVAVEGHSLFTLAAMTKGVRGSSIELQIITSQGVARRLEVARDNVSFENLSIRQYGRLKVIEIRAFQSSTAGRLRKILETWPSDRPVVIDLRENAGGDLHAAVDAGMYFLDAGSIVGTIKEVDHTTVYRSNGNTVNLPYPVYLWQSGATASAAEIFIAALTQNDRGVSIGARTFGKGTKQDVIPLSDGSVLILTTGLLLTPDGHPLDGVGLPPDVALDKAAPSSADYVAKVEEQIAHRK